jgi:acyl-CoA synthetase (AMP-forming)/AMP-acid ligase II
VTLPDIGLGDLVHSVAARIPDALALAHGDREITWGEMDDRTGRLAAAFRELGVGPDHKVAQLLYNCPEYNESVVAAFKLRAAPVNVNYRYQAEEIRYLLDNSDATVVVAAPDLVERVLDVRHRLPALRAIVQVGGDADAPLPDGVLSYEGLIAGHEPMEPLPGGGDQLWFLYTGGTTGHPKGVMWPHGVLVTNSAPFFLRVGLEPPTDLASASEAAVRFHELGVAWRFCPGSPLMHGTGGMSSILTFILGGAVVTLTGRSFDADEMLRTVERRRLTHLAIVGDVFGKRLVAALEAAEAAGRPYDLSSLVQIASSGAMWSEETKLALLERHDMILFDSLGASEAVGFASQMVTRAGGVRRTARFELGPTAQVFTDDGRRVVPGSGEIGRLAVGGAIPLGYYKDPEKTERTYPLIEGQRWAVPGDYATVEADGTITLLGRGSVSVNTGGEKVYPEEVEEALKTHPAVVDCTVVGVPDEEWGEAVTAVLSLAAPADRDELVAHAAGAIARYKLPKHVVVVDEVYRAPNGKADYRWARETALERLGKG